jgi:hypothetical protein
MFRFHIRSPLVQAYRARLSPYFFFSSGFFSLGLGVSFFFVKGINFASWALVRVSVEFWEWYKLFCQHAYTRLLLVEKREQVADG